MDSWIDELDAGSDTNQHVIILVVAVAGSTSAAVEINIDLTQSIHNRQN